MLNFLTYGDFHTHQYVKIYFSKIPVTTKLKSILHLEKSMQN